MDAEKMLNGVGAGQLNLGGMTGLTAVDGPVVHSRAGLYIFLHALVGQMKIPFEQRVLTSKSWLEGQPSTTRSS